jgi:hypothetical protein
LLGIFGCYILHSFQKVVQNSRQQISYIVNLTQTVGRGVFDEVVGVGGKLAYIRAYYCFKG